MEKFHDEEAQLQKSIVEDEKRFRDGQRAARAHRLVEGVNAGEIAEAAEKRHVAQVVNRRLEGRVHDERHCERSGGAQGQCLGPARVCTGASAQFATERGRVVQRHVAGRFGRRHAKESSRAAFDSASRHALFRSSCGARGDLESEGEALAWL